MNQVNETKVESAAGAYQHPSINPTLLQTMNSINQSAMNPNDAAFQQALRHALEVAGQTNNNWNQSPSIQPTIHPSMSQSITPSVLHQLNNQPLAPNQPANPQNMHLLNQLISQNTQNLTQMNTRTLSQMNNQSINNLNAHSINQLSALALNPLNSQSLNGQTFSDPHQQMNQLNSMSQSVNPLAQIDPNSYVADMTPAQLRVLNQSITQSISQLTQNDQMRLAALIDNATRNGAVTPHEIAAILSRTNSQTNNQPMHPSISQAVNPLFNPVAANRPINQPFSQGQPNIAFPRAVRLDASKPSDTNDPSINFPVGQTSHPAAASQMPWLPLNSSNNQIPQQQVPSMLPFNPMMPTPNSMFHPQTVNQPVNPASQALNQTIIAQLSRPSSTISNDQHVGMKRSINATITQTPLQQPHQPTNQTTNPATEAPTRLSREEAAVHRKLKHREIDAKRRKREKSITDTLAQLSGQANSQALNPKDRLTTMEIAVNKYRSLTHRALKLQNLAKKLECQLVAAGVSIQNEVGYDEDIDDGMNEMLTMKPTSGDSASGSDQSASHGAFQPFQSALSQQIASHQLAATRNPQANSQGTSQPVNPLLIAPHLVSQLPLSAFQNGQPQNNLSALGNINPSELYATAGQTQPNASTQ